MCEHCVGRNSCHKLECEKGTLNPFILCANPCKNHDIHIRCDVVELSENSWISVTTKLHLEMYEMLFNLSYNLTYKVDKLDLKT